MKHNSISRRQALHLGGLLMAALVGCGYDPCDYQDCSQPFVLTATGGENQWELLENNFPDGRPGVELGFRIWDASSQQFIDPEEDNFDNTEDWTYVFNEGDSVLFYPLNSTTSNNT